MTLTDVLLAIGILAVVLISDLGTRKLGLHRILRPIIASGVTVALYLHTIPTGGNDLYLELAGGAIGIACGLVSIRTIKVSRAADGELLTRAGLAYALLWIATVGGRLAFGYGAQHVFPAAVHSFMLNHNITTPNAITAAFILMILAEVSTRTISLTVRSHRTRPLSLVTAA